MTRRVVVGAAALQKAHDEFREDRTADGSPSEYDFVSGPLGAAFRIGPPQGMGLRSLGFSSLRVRQEGEMKWVHLLPVFGGCALYDMMRTSTQ